MRRLAALTVAAALAASLAACSSAPAGTIDGCTPAALPGDSSSLVTATGDIGSTTSTATFPTPLRTKKLQVSVISQGTGPLVRAGDYVDFVATQYDATTGATAFAAQSARYGASDATDLNRIFECVTVGSRLAAVVPTGDTAGSTDAAVLVIDVMDRIPGKADGVSQLPANGFPAVVTAPSGQPGITVPDAAAPTKLESSVLKQGGGAVVKAGDAVVLQYSEFTWDQPATEVTSSWTEAAPHTYAAKDYDASDGSGLWPGTTSAIVGQKLGSQVIVIVPPDASYASGTTAPDSVADGSTRIYVIDILAIQKS